jgi:hypothetical protein
MWCLEGDVTRVWPIEGWWGIRRLSRPDLCLGKVDVVDLQDSKLFAVSSMARHFIDRLERQWPVISSIMLMVPKMVAEVEQSLATSGLKMCRTDRGHVSMFGDAELQ